MRLIAKLVYLLFWFNAIVLVAGLFYRKLITTYINKPKYSTTLFIAEFLLVVWYIYDCYSEYVKMENDLGTQVLLRWQKDRHRLERDMYLGLCTLLTSIMILMVKLYEYDR